VPAPAASVPCCKDDPVLGPFFKMLRLGMPPPAVKAKMAAAGLDSALLDLSPDAPSPLPQQKQQSVASAAPAAPGAAAAASALLAGISGFDKARGLKHAAPPPPPPGPGGVIAGITSFDRSRLVSRDPAALHPAAAKHAAAAAPAPESLGDQLRVRLEALRAKLHPSVAPAKRGGDDSDSDWSD
jgi:hypothetical protein